MDKKTFIETHVVDRKGTDSFKWDALGKRFGDPDLISMWVADMEFMTSGKIREALVDRVSHGVFGYTFPGDDYYEAFSGWMEKRHGFPIDKEWVRFSPGVVPAIYWMINAFTNPGDACLVLTPVYYPFHNAIRDTGRKRVAVDLVNTEGCFTMDYEAIEAAIEAHQVKLFIQCSPHNPVGRVWTEEELERILALCRKHGVLVVSDEIHQDIILGSKKFIPAANIAGGIHRDNLVTLSSASKTFNLASLVHAHIVITDKGLRDRYDAYARGVYAAEANLMGITATKAGYLHGEEWLETLLEVVRDNDRHVRQELGEKAPDIVIPPLEGTYLLLLDLRRYISSEETKAFIQDRCRLAVDFGEWFGEGFEGFVRLNLATAPAFVEKATANIIEEIGKLQRQVP